MRGPATPRPQQLGERDREVLRDVVLTYIVSAEPVSSRTIARHGQLSLSAATIRNVMADLEEWGYLQQPHTSAGRVPTASGYHLFIDSLMQSRSLPARDRRMIDEILAKAPPDVHQLLEAVVLVLKELSHQVSIVLAPAPSETVLKSLELVPVAEHKVLCVMVSSAGVVDTKVLEVEEPLSREDLVWISNYLTENFANLSLAAIRERLIALMAEERAQVDRLLAWSIELARRGFEASGAERQLIFDGTHELLAQPELSDIGRVRQLFDTFKQKARLVSILNRLIHADGVRVLIGAESELTSGLDFSLIAAPYGIGSRSLGSVAIFGPSRMEYPRMIPLVRYLGEALSGILEARFADEQEERLE
ncbi:MAG TPA: heat-inducible transcriptional repressor HrcA [Thermoanaerobaculia bacterium]|nr:heat-inducible transcriptional repressor HrcA [Thermoanaerobaculia bacterium]